jgi:hypothetical protein
MLRSAVFALLAACGTSTPPPPSFTGDWTLAVDSPSKTGPIALTFTQAGVTVDGDGTVTSDTCAVPRTDASAKGSYANQHLDLMITLADNSGAESIFHFDAIASSVSDPIHGTITGNYSCTDLGDAPATLTPQ